MSKLENLTLSKVMLKAIFVIILLTTLTIVALINGNYLGVIGIITCLGYVIYKINTTLSNVEGLS